MKRILYENQRGELVCTECVAVTACKQDDTRWCVKMLPDWDRNWEVIFSDHLASEAKQVVDSLYRTGIYVKNA